MPWYKPAGQSNITTWYQPLQRTNHGQINISYIAPIIWNNLTDSLKQITLTLTSIELRSIFFTESEVRRISRISLLLIFLFYCTTTFHFYCYYHFNYYYIIVLIIITIIVTFINGRSISSSTSRSVIIIIVIISSSSINKISVSLYINLYLWAFHLFPVILYQYILPMFFKGPQWK